MATFFLAQSRKVAKSSRLLTLWLCFPLLLLFATTSCFPSVLQHPTQTEPRPVTEAPLATNSPQISTAGQLIYDSPGGKLFSMPIAAKAEPAPLFRLPPGTFAFQPIWSAANKQIAYGYIAPEPTTGKLNSARLWVSDIDGTNARAVTQPPAGFAGTYRDPAWSPDGCTLWASVELPEKDAAGVVRFRSEIRRIELTTNELATGSETVIISDARGPAVSPSNEWIAYLAKDNQTNQTAIWRSRVDGSNAEILVAGDQFEEIYVPMRFSPDGKILAFAAADAANQLQRTPQPEARLWFDAPLRDIADLFRPRTAHAHGLFPADVWLVDVETGLLQRLTQLSEDHPTPVWSPDGQHLAFAGVLGVYIIDVAERSAVRITEKSVDGQIEWLEK